MNDEVLVVTGPTATGKTELGVLLAETLSGEVISADSMQIYEYMDIGTAKPTKEEMRGIPHHMMGTASPFVRYSAAEYVREASQKADDILRRGKTPIIVGGTGLYIESLITGRDFAPRGGDDTLRKELEKKYDELGGEAMLRRLSELDPKRAEKLHPNDKKRIIRAIEAAENGETLTGHDEVTKLRPPRYRAKYIVLSYRDRQTLYSRIDRRVDMMAERGLMDEVRSLLDMGLSPEHTAMQAIGYKEAVSFLCGETDEKTALDMIKQASRRYAKRQISWCSRYTDALYIFRDEMPDISDILRVSTEFWLGK